MFGYSPNLDTGLLLAKYVSSSVNIDINDKKNEGP